MQLPLYTLIRFYFWSTGTRNLNSFHAPAVCHAEVNALLNRNVKSVKGCALYCNYSPCWDCAREMLQAGIVKVVYGEMYKQEHLDHIKEVTGPDGRYVHVFLHATRKVFVTRIATIDVVTFMGCY